jgi:hypothetical protein
VQLYIFGNYSTKIYDIIVLLNLNYVIGNCFFIYFAWSDSVQYSGCLNLWKTEGANARLSFARAGKALAVSGANNSVQVIAGQGLLQWTEEKSRYSSGELSGLPGIIFTTIVV